MIFKYLILKKTLARFLSLMFILSYQKKRILVHEKCMQQKHYHKVFPF